MVRELKRGFVSLVGAGPGDPELLTLRAVSRLRAAEVVLHDALVSPDVLALTPPAARLIPVGKRRGAAPITQRAIEAALIREARAGFRVVRLKGGDPFVFGRGGEEALALARRGIPFEIVPGLSAGTALPALAGIPLTHRGLSGSAAFITAHDLSEKSPRARERVRQLARGADTLALFMAGAELARARDALLAGGLPQSTPVALIESGSLPGEWRHFGVLRELEHLAHERCAGPLLVVVGKTVALAARIKQTRSALPVHPQPIPVHPSSPALSRRNFS